MTFLSIEITQQIKSGVKVSTLKKHLQDAFLSFADNLEKAQIELVFIDEKQMQILNKEYRGLDKPTDVLSFPTYFKARNQKVFTKIKNPNLGTIFICPDVAKNQIGKFGNDYGEEIIELAIHGLRHLLGHDHDDKGNWINKKG